MPTKMPIYEGNKNLYMDNYKENGFVDVDLNDIERGDLIMMWIKGTVSHGGVYLGDDKLLHHFSNRMAQQDSLARWRNRIAVVARYTGEIDEA